MLADFDARERAELASLLANPVPFVIERRGSELLNDLIRAIPEGMHAVVGNDHGLLVPIEKIRSLPLERWVDARELL